jgi:hypothetical protein
MNYAHAFLSDKKNNNFLIYQTFSFLSIKQNKRKINLYANIEYIEICKKIGLDYDNYIEISKKDSQKHYWSSSKMEALKINNDIIIDHDFFLLKDISNLIINDVIYSHKEYVKDNGWYNQDPLIAFEKSIPKNVIQEWDYLIDTIKNKKEQKNNHAFNCSIIGFKDKNIAKDYATKSLLLFEYLNQKYQDVSQIKNNIYLPTIAEQLFLSFYSKYHNLQTFALSNEYKTGPYIHLGHMKSDKNSQYSNKILNYIKINKPDIYQNLIKFIV